MSSGEGEKISGSQKRRPVVVPDICLRRRSALPSVDHGHSLTSLHLPPAVLGSLPPERTRCILPKAKCMVLPPSSWRQATVHRTVAFGFFESVRYHNIKTHHPDGWCVFMATPNGLEPSTSSVTGWRANRLHHRAMWWNGLDYSRKKSVCKVPKLKNLTFPWFSAHGYGWEWQTGRLRHPHRPGSSGCRSRRGRRRGSEQAG